jgi:biotin transport system substrate-specific component
MKNKAKLQNLIHIAIFTAIIAVCAQIRVPMPFGVPFTMQTFAVPLAGVVLGMKNGTIAVIVYILLGAIGVPVFNGFQGSPAMIVGPTGGFILSFPIMAILAGIESKRYNYVFLTLWLILGAVINYACGMLMFAYVTNVSLETAFVRVVVPFIGGGIVKIIMVVLVGKRIRQIMSRFL